ncbi:MAG: NADH-quinone oxidoreductase subunit M, partial [Methylococcales bacterium]|nr:NADH-quinone oxidoreductase subunit M [Methylococcales bacterium]
ISAALFLAVGVMYDRIHSREIADYGGVANVMPVFAAFAVFFAMANSGLPGTSGFVGEFMVILASFNANFWIAFLAATTLILGAAYSLWMIKRVILGKVVHDHVEKMEDLNRRELILMVALAIPVLVFGIYPDPIVEVMHVSVENLLQHISTQLTVAR